MQYTNSKSNKYNSQFKEKNVLKRSVIMKNLSIAEAYHPECLSPHMPINCQVDLAISQLRGDFQHCKNHPYGHKVKKPSNKSLYAMFNCSYSSQPIKFRKITEKMAVLATFLQCLVLGLVIIANSQVDIRTLSLINICSLTCVFKFIVKLNYLVDIHFHLLNFPRN